MSPDLATDYAAARESAVGTWIRRDVIEVRGKDAGRYLQGQVSQNVDAITDSSWSFVLQPHGKVDALVRITRVDDGFLIDTDPGFGALVHERLERFKLRVAVDMQQLDWKVLSVRGPRSVDVRVDGAVVSPANWPGIGGVDFFGPDIEVPAGLEMAGSALHEVLRIESGMPRMGYEIDERTIPAELGINQLAISFTKGCYTGQELVARIDARGNNVPRNLRCVWVTFPSHDLPDRGAKLVPADRSVRPTKPFGLLSSVAFSPRVQAAVGLCLVRRDVAVPVDTEIVSADRAMPARLEAAPIPAPQQPLAEM